MISNALFFNHPKTIYYKAAKHVLWVGDFLISNFNRPDEIEESTCCLGCKKGHDDEKMLICDGCNEANHMYCLDPPLKVMPAEDEDFFCDKCDPSKHCDVCKSTSDAAKILLCNGCDTGYHLYCLTPILTAVPKGFWFCSSFDPSTHCNSCLKPVNEKDLCCSKCKRYYHSFCSPKEFVENENWSCHVCSPPEKKNPAAPKKESSSLNSSPAKKIIKKKWPKPYVKKVRHDGKQETRGRPKKNEETNEAT